MARWNNLEDDELDSRIIYTGAYGFAEVLELLGDADGAHWDSTCGGYDG